jgi:integrase
MGRKSITGLRKRNGSWHIQKKIRRYGPLYESTGTGDRAEAEAILIKRIEDIRKEVIFGIRQKRTFREVAAHYLETETKKSLVTDAFHLEQLVEHIGDLHIDQVHDHTLALFVAWCRQRGNKNKTIGLKLAVARRILNLAATSWKDERTGLTWLAQAPKITMPKVTDARPPRPISWEEQRAFFPLLPQHLHSMALFAVHTAARDEEVCGLKWAWEAEVPELGESVFALPGSATKNGEPRLIVLNRVARSVVEQCRGKHPEYVFVYGKKSPHRVGTMNNTAWQKARQKAGLDLRVHDLRHTAGRRMRAAGVPLETRRAVLGHKTGDITTHYSAAEIAELLTAVRKIEDGQSSPTLTLIRAA